MSDIADKIYAATGLTLNAEAAAKIGHMIRLARQEAADEIEKLRAENAKLAASNHAYLSDYQEAAAEIEKLRAALKTARRDALGECISICNAVAHANRVEYPAKWKDRPEGIPHDWQQAWETCAETAEDIAATIRALGEKE